MCGFSFTVFLSAFQLFPTAPFRILDTGGSTFAAGLFLGLLTYASALSAPFTGALADRVGKRRMLIVTSLVIAAFSVAYGLSRSHVVPLVIVFFHGLVWSGLLSASAAYMTDFIPESRRAERIGYWGMYTMAAIAAAPTLGLWVYRYGWGWLCAEMTLLNLGMAAIAYRLDDVRTSARVAPLPRGRGLVEWRVVGVALCLFVCSFGYGGVTSFVALHAERLGIEPKSIFLVTFGAVSLAVRPLVSPFADRIGHRRVLIPALLFVTVGLALLTVARSRWSMAGAAAVFALGFGNMYPSFVAHVVRFVDPARRGAAFGGILAAFDTGIGTGSIALGWVAERRGFVFAYAVAAALSALSVPYFLWAERRLLRPGGPGAPS
jgi:MFS family permease